MQILPAFARTMVSATTVCNSAYAQQLLPTEAELSGTFKISSYDTDSEVQSGKAWPLSENKAKLKRAWDVSDVSRACAPRLGTAFGCCVMHTQRQNCNPH